MNGRISLFKFWEPIVDIVPELLDLNDAVSDLKSKFDDQPEFDPLLYKTKIGDCK